MAFKISFHVEVGFVFDRDFIHNNYLVHRNLAPLWIVAYDLYKSKSLYKPFQNYSLCLMLPLFEAFLRAAFVQCHSLTPRLLLAIRQDYYVTFNEIFNIRFKLGSDGRVPGASNKIEVKSDIANRLHELLPLSLRCMAADLMLLPQGLRFRDRLSHGQVDLVHLNSRSAQYLVSFIVSTMDCLNCGAKAWMKGKSMFIAKTCYSSHYHPVAMFLDEMSELAFATRKLSIQHRSLFSFVSFCSDPIVYLKKVHRNIFLSWIPQSQNVLSALNKCVKLMGQFVDNINMFIQTRFDGSSLRSRQRDNMVQFKQIIPDLIHRKHVLVMYTLLDIVGLLESTTAVWNSGQRKVQLRKSVRLLCTAAENLVKFSGSGQHQWTLCEHHSLLLVHHSSEIKSIVQSDSSNLARP